MAFGGLPIEVLVWGLWLRVLGWRFTAGFEFGVSDSDFGFLSRGREVRVLATYG